MEWHGWLRNESQASAGDADKVRDISFQYQGIPIRCPLQSIACRAGLRKWLLQNRFECVGRFQWN